MGAIIKTVEMDLVPTERGVEEVVERGAIPGNEQGYV